MIRKIIVAALVVFGCVAPMWAGDSSLKVMTQNMDAGTDLGYALYGLQQPDPRPYIDATLAELDASLIPARATALAKEIASQKPDIIALQEVTLWRAGPTPETATTVLWDQLELLMTALKDLDAPYRVVAVNTLTDIPLPTTEKGPGALRFTDRDVLLARSDLSPSEFHISDVHTHIYKAALTFGEFTVRRGFISALARVHNKVFRIANTHLENKFPLVEAAAAIQKLQAAELIHFMRNSPKPVILAGDYNSDAILGASGTGPDNTDTVAFIQEAGYADSWATANPGVPGATWPLYLEDNTAPPPFFVAFAPFDRIDLIFFKGLQVVNSVQIGAGTTFPGAASDHTGVMTEFSFEP